VMADSSFTAPLGSSNSSNTSAFVRRQYLTIPDATAPTPSPPPFQPCLTSPYGNASPPPQQAHQLPSLKQAFIKASAHCTINKYSSQGLLLAFHVPATHAVGNCPTLAFLQNYAAPCVPAPHLLTSQPLSTLSSMKPPPFPLTCSLSSSCQDHCCIAPGLVHDCLPGASQPHTGAPCLQSSPPK
jgi:hypothetical protein